MAPSPLLQPACVVQVSKIIITFRMRGDRVVLRTGPPVRTNHEVASGACPRPGSRSASWRIALATTRSRLWQRSKVGVDACPARIREVTDKKDVETLGRFRHRYQQLRQSIRDNVPLPWDHSEYSDYVEFKTLAPQVAAICRVRPCSARAADEDHVEHLRSSEPQKAVRRRRARGVTKGCCLDVSAEESCANREARRPTSTTGLKSPGTPPITPRAWVRANGKNRNLGRLHESTEAGGRLSPTPNSSN